MSGTPRLVVLVDRAEITARIIEGICSITRPPEMTAAQALSSAPDDLLRPALASADLVLEYLNECVLAAGVVQ